ncbi:disulfide-isomerase [Blastocystis sp. ATCC 50177/Nand II]|uniref:Disulfide-isomerase n=1 Tax=Blastocystis sp. subtype 1 (strain ATCC 50177 / NandII) TaxID=478820 RepID=A0A196S6Z8_BLAHN|nr:disulfide-isomerase [Blastocystis sp. ATCC 50177/Nand II]
MGYCKDFAPTWSLMSDIAVEGNNAFQAIKVELGDDKEWKDRFEVTSFPEFGVFVDGKYDRFNGKKDAGDLLHFVANRTADGILHLGNVEAVEYLHQHSNAVVVSLFDDDSVEDQTFKSCVLREENVLFVKLSASVRADYMTENKLEKPTILMLKSYDEHRYKDAFYDRSVEWLVLLIDAKNAKFPSALTAEYVEFCKGVKGATCYYIQHDEKNVYEFYVKDAKVEYPQLMVVHRTRGYHFKYYLEHTKKVGPEGWRSFVEGCLAKTIKPVLPSLPVPKMQSGPVTVAVGTTFEELVMKSEEDVVVQMYSNYCDHCTKMLKRFEKVATFFKDQKNIRFVRFDASENTIDVEQIYVKYFHSVLYVRKGKEVEVIEYPRSKKVWRTKALIAWVADQMKGKEEPVEPMEPMEEEL